MDARQRNTEILGRRRRIGSGDSAQFFYESVQIATGEGEVCQAFGQPLMAY